MFRNSELLNGLTCVQRFFGIATASDMDNQVAKMLHKNNAVKGQVEVQIAKLFKSDFYNDAAKKSRLENVLEDLDAWIEALQYLQMRMHKDNFGMVSQFFDDQFWPLTVKLSTRYQFATGIFGDWLYDTNSLHMLMPEYVDARKSSREGANSASAKLRKRLKSLRLNQSGEVKLCNDCGLPMIPCEDCGALVKPCFIEMGMTHVCEHAPASGTLN